MTHIEVVTVEGLVVGVREVTYMLVIKDMFAQRGTTISSTGAVTDGTFEWDNFGFLRFTLPVYSAAPGNSHIIVIVVVGNVEKSLLTSPTAHQARDSLCWADHLAA